VLIANIITGYADIVMKVEATDLSGLEDILDKIGGFEEVNKTETFVVLREAVSAPSMVGQSTAFILFATSPHRTNDIQKELARLDGVIGADKVTGEYDIVVETSIPIGRLPSKTEEMQRIDGVRKTMTCLPHSVLEKCQAT